MTGSVGDMVNETMWAMAERLGALVPERETKRFGTVRAHYGALPTPAVNRIYAFDMPSRTDLEAAMDWLTDHDVPIQVTVPAPLAAALGDDHTALDLVKTDETPGMALPSLKSVPGSESDATISVVTELDELAAYLTVAKDVFDIEPGFIDQLQRPAVLNDDAFAFLIARQDQQTVACGQLLQYGAAAGVFFIGVRRAFRRHGLGEAMTRAVLRAGREAGCSIGVLDSSELGYPLYEEMGFETVVTYHHFEPTT